MTLLNKDIKKKVEVQAATLVNQEAEAGRFHIQGLPESRPD